MAQIGIVGAGMAGLVAGRALQAAGHEVRLFDKGRRPGGRSSSRTEFDHGASYFTVRDPTFAAEVEQWREAGLVGPWAPRLAVRGPAGLTPKGSGGPTRFVGVPSMGSLALSLADGLAVERAQVTSVVGSPRGVELAGEQGSLGLFDRVGLTVPAPQAAALIEPADAPLAARVRRAQMAPTWTLMLAFSEPLPTPFDAIFVNDGPLSFVVREASKPGRPADERFVAHASHVWSQAALEWEPAAVRAALEPAFFAALDLEPAPVERADVHRWRYAAATTIAEVPCLVGTDPRIALAGDWTAGPRVEGAYRAGLQLAEALRG